MRPPDPFADRYTKLRLVGRGGFGVVYRAWDTEMERDIALKLLNPELAVDEDWRKRFRLEATAASKLNHPNITIVFDRGDYQSQPFIVMEFVEGEPLSKIIEHQIPLSDPERLFLIEQLCDGLHYAHQRGIVHRDVKPVNLVVREDHDGTALIRTLKILDFGIAKVVNTGQTSTGGMMFTPSYVSPEQIQGVQVDRRSDMFAVGAVAYELLVGRKAFDILSKNPFTFLEEVKHKIVEEPHLPMTATRPDVDPELSAVIDRALAKAPEDRFKDLAEMRRSLHRIRERLEESAPSTSQTTIVLPAKLQAVVKQARQALEADDPSAAILHLQEALGAASNKIVKRFIEQSLEEAQERQAAKQIERRARDEGAARSAIDTARAAFEAGDATLAIRRLDEFKPAELVAEAKDNFARAAGLVRRAERIVAEGEAAARAAVLHELEAFAPADLVKAPLARLRAHDGLERAVAARAQAAVESAREAFAAGRRSEAVNSLDKFEDKVRVAAALDELREADGAIELASTGVRSGTRRARAEALERLEAFPYAELVAATLAELRAVDRQLTAKEDQEESERAAAARAQSAVKSAREAFAAGKRTEAIQALEQFDDAGRVAAVLKELREANAAIERASTAVRSGARRARADALEQLEASPHRTLVVNVLTELRTADRHMRKAEDLERARQREEQERAAAEEAARNEIARARKRFLEGAHKESIDGLRRFVDPALVADAVRSLERAAAEISRVEERVRTGGADERRAAIDELARSDAAELASTALASLRKLDADRSADERSRQQEQQALEAEKAAAARAQSAIQSARDEFSGGNRTAAIRTLERFDDPGRVAAALHQLREAAAAIETASGAVRKGQAGDRAAALDRLAAFPAPELVARDLAELRTVDRQKVEAEQKAAVEEAASGAIARARQRFAEGAHKEAIDGLRQFVNQKLVASEVASLQRVAAALARTEQRVRTGNPEERRAAIEQLSSVAGAELATAGLASLRQLDATRTADEQRRHEEEQRALAAARERSALEEERRTLESRARQLFVKGSHDEALRLLKAFSAPALVADTLRNLREAADEIDAARAAVAREPAPLRRTAIEKLERREPKDLFAHPLVELRALDAERRVAEQQAEAERIAADAERVSVEARQQFARGEHEDALKTLEGFAPVLPPVSRALEDLRREYQQILAARAEEEKERQRLEAERAAKVREVAKLVADADKAVAEKRFDDAAAVLDGASKLLPDSGDLAKARTRLARAIDAEERRVRQQRIRAVLDTVPAPIDRGEFTAAAEKLTEAETLGATSAELTALREQLRAAQAEHAQISTALTTVKEAVARARNTAAADDRLKDLDRTLSGAIQAKPSARAAAALWPEYREALKQARSLREEAGIAEARARVSRALTDGSVRKAERALQEAEASYPGAAVWKSVRAEVETLRQTRAAEPSLAATALEKVRRNPLILWIAAAVLILALAASAWVFWPRAVVPPPDKPATRIENPPPPKVPSLFEQASSRLAAGQRSEALTLALQSLRADPKDGSTIQLLSRLRNDASSATSAARDKAVSANATSRTGFKAAEQKRAEAEAITDPLRTDETIRTFDEAADLYRRSETETFSAEEFLESARQERAAGRLDRAVDYAIDGLKAHQGNDALETLLRSIRTEAANRVTAARSAAQKAGATEASPPFKSARDKESAGTERTSPEQTREALASLRDAEALYRQAEKEAEDFRDSINADLATADREFKAERYDAAERAVNAALGRESTNRRGLDLRRQITAARTRIANRQRAATLVDDAKRTRGQKGVDLLLEAQKFDATNTEIGPLLTQFRSELGTPPIAATVTKAKDLIRQRNYAGAAESIVGVLGKAPKNSELMKVLDETLEAAENDANAEKRTADIANASGRPEYANAAARFQSAANARKGGRPEDAESVVRDYAAAAGLYRDAAAKAKEATPPPPPPPTDGDALARTAILQMLAQYEAAYESLDPARVRRFKPSFKNFPNGLRSTDLTISNESVVLSQDRQSATVNFTLQYRNSYSRGVPSEMSNPRPVNVTWRVQRTPTGWMIVD